MTLTLELPGDVEERLRAEAARAGVPPEDYVLRKVAEPAKVPGQDVMMPGDRILAIAEKFWAAIPDEERADLPTDAAQNYKHYLYGYPREETK
jgi:hypothetical protein